MPKSTQKGTDTEMTGFINVRKKKPVTHESAESVERSPFELLPTDKIAPNPGQPRRYFDSDALLSLSDSIKRYGVLQPISVTFDRASGTYVLVAGERRLRAAKLLGLETIPAVIIGADAQMSEELALIENIQREELGMFEEARAIASLISKHGMTQEEAAGKLSVSQSYVANKLRLLKFSDDEEREIIDSGLTERHARALLRIKDKAVREKAMRKIILHRMNVAGTEEYIDHLLEDAKPDEADRQRVRIAVRDVRLFCNSIDRAVETIKRAGVNVETIRTDTPDATHITISIPKGANQRSQGS